MEVAGKVAVALPPQGGDWTPSATLVAGLSVFARVIFAAERAGVTKFVILSGAATSSLQKLLEGGGSKAKVVWADEDLSLVVDALRDVHVPLFFLNGVTFFDPAVLRKAAETFRDDREILFPKTPNLKSQEKGGVALASPRLLPSFLEAIEQKRLLNWGDFLTFSQTYKVETFDPPQGALYLSVSSLPIQEVERRLYRSLGKSTDTVIIRLARKALIPFLKRLAETSATPNHVTLAGFLIGLGSIGLFLKAEYGSILAGAALFTLSFVVDLADGMLARLKFLESRKGAWMDFTLDNLLHLGVFASLIRVVSLHSPGEYVLYFGGLLIGGSLLSALLVGCYLTGRQSTVDSRQPTMERLMETLRHRDFSLVLLLFALFDRVEWFLFAAAIGANLFWPVVLYLLIKGRRSEGTRCFDR